MTDAYKKAYTEVIEILKYFPEEEYAKIPEEKINFYKENMDKNYVFKFDPNVELEKQNISREASAVFVLLFNNYFANDRQKETLKKLLEQNELKLEEEKREKYNPDNLFNSNIKDKNLENQIEGKQGQLQEKTLIEYKEPLLKRIINFILQKMKLKK